MSRATRFGSAFDRASIDLQMTSAGSPQHPASRVDWSAVAADGAHRPWP